LEVRHVALQPEAQATTQRNSDTAILPVLATSMAAAVSAAQTVAITQDCLLQLMPISLQTFILFGNMCYTVMQNSWEECRA
jgi:hypothetical protein